jgi:hypothetical protein
MTIPTPAAGSYTIRVHGISVIIDSPGAAPAALLRQDFAIALTNGSTLTRQ